jgi:hypothetical protein
MIIKNDHFYCSGNCEANVLNIWSAIFNIIQNMVGDKIVSYSNKLQVGMFLFITILQMDKSPNW